MSLKPVVERITHLATRWAHANGLSVRPSTGVIDACVEQACLVDSQMVEEAKRSICGAWRDRVRARDGACREARRSLSIESDRQSSLVCRLLCFAPETLPHASSIQRPRICFSHLFAALRIARLYTVLHTSSINLRNHVRTSKWQSHSRVGNPGNRHSPRPDMCADKISQATERPYRLPCGE